MTESKPTAPGRIIRQTPGSLSVVTPPASGHTYLSQNQFQPYVDSRGKVNQTLIVTTTAAGSHHPMKMNPATTQFHVQLSKPLTVVTTYPTKPNAGVLQVPRQAYHGAAEKLIVPVNSQNSEPGVKTMKTVQKVSHLKQLPATVPGSTKTLLSVSAPDHISVISGINVIPQIKKSQDAGKPVLLGQGLRQPSSNFTHQVAANVVTTTQNSQTNATSVSVPTSTVTLHRSKHVRYQVDSSGTVQPAPSNATALPPAQDLKIKHSNVVHQPKTTISISMKPQAEQGHRNTTVNATTNISGKQVYQIMGPSPQLQPQSGLNQVKNLQTMIVTQVSPSVSTVLTQPSTALSTGQQIPVITCGGSAITYVPAPAPPSIPIAKVYPQQQPISRLSVTTASNRLTVPIVSATSSSTTVIPKHPTNLLQVGPIKTSTVTSAIATSQQTPVPTIPVSINKSATNPAPVLQGWYSHTQVPISNIRPVPQIAQPALSAPGTARGQPPVLFVDNLKANSHHPVPNRSSPSDGARGNSTSSTGPTTPTMSPKPAILRRQRPDSSAPKKLSFQQGPGTTNNQRRDLFPSPYKPGDKRPFTVNRHKVASSKPELKPNEIVMVQTSAATNSEKVEIKPVLPNQVYSKQLIASNGLAQLKIGNLKSSGQFPVGAKETNNQSYFHPLMSGDVKVKMEPNAHSYGNTVKSESATSASQMLHQYQNQSFHSYASAAEPLPHRIMSKASGQQMKTNTLFSPNTFLQSRPSNHSNGRKPAIDKPPSNASGPNLQQVTYLAPAGAMTNANHNSFPQNVAIRTDDLDKVKKENTQMKVGPGTQPNKTAHLGENTEYLQTNHIIQNQVSVNMTHQRPWLNTHNEQVAGLSPRKRPRKQTHIVSDVPPDVEMMEDEESTDDADECEDEPMVEADQKMMELSATPVSKLPGNKSTMSPHTFKSETLTTANKKSIKEEQSSKPVFTNSESPSSPVPSDSKPVTEYTDSQGVRYVITRKRPSISVLNKLKPNGRSVANHFMNYSDIKVKEKKVVIGDFMNDKKRLSGYNVGRFVLQLRDLAESEGDLWRRMNDVFEGLVKHKQTVLGDFTADDLMTSPSPGTPNSLSNSFSKGLSTPGAMRRGSLSGMLENGPVGSPSTPLDRRTTKLKEEITKSEEFAQANLQRCRVVLEQLSETESMLLKSIDHRTLAESLFEASLNQKSQSTTSTSQTTKRLSKKKTNS